MAGCCSVVELRQYTVHPDQRDALIEIFDREFVETQEAEGMRIVGQFRDLDRPDRFVWVRGYADMVARRRELEAFYTGVAWKTHGKAAAATMVDVSDVLLLRPLTSATVFADLPARPAPQVAVSGATIVVTICALEAPTDRSKLAEALLAALADTGAPAVAAFVEDPSKNDYPSLPVREGEHVVVWFQRAPDRAQRVAVSSVACNLLPGLLSPPLQLHLEPTPRSQLR
jgi:NIPSNAP